MHFLLMIIESFSIVFTVACGAILIIAFWFGRPKPTDGFTVTLPCKKCGHAGGDHHVVLLKDGRDIKCMVKECVCYQFTSSGGYYGTV